MLINQYEIEKYIYATAKRADLRVNWTDDMQVSTNGKIINLPRITSSTTKEQAEDMMGYVAHEVGHIHNSDFKYLNSKGMDPQHSLLGAIANVIEDDGVDAINSEEFFGDRLIRNESVDRILSSITEKFKKMGKMPPQAEAIGAIMGFSVAAQGDYYSSAAAYYKDFEEVLGEKGRGWLKKLMDGPYYKEMKEIRKDTSKGRTEKAYNIARRIFEEVFEQNADEEEERCRQRMKKERGEGGEEEGDEEGKDGKEGKGKGRGKQSSKVGKWEDREHPFSEWDYRPFMEDQHDEFIKSTYVSKGSHINYSKYVHSGGRGYRPTPLKDTIVVNYPLGTSNNGHFNPSGSKGSRHDEFYNKFIRENHAGEAFANKVRMLLQIRSKGKTQYGTKKGQLHAANTYRVILKDAPGYNERVFKRRIETDILDTAVLCLGDVSGSMSGPKNAHQMLAMGQLNDSIGNALRIPCQMMGFTEHDCRNTIFIWRRFEDQVLSRERLVDRMIHTSQHMNQNADGDAIMYAYHLLKQRKERRKVLIVTSDGSPASSKGGDVYGYTASVIKEIEKRKDVDIYAIGIMDRNVASLYKQHSIIKQADELEAALLSIIERKVI